MLPTLFKIFQPELWPYNLAAEKKICPLLLNGIFFLKCLLKSKWHQKSKRLPITVDQSPKFKQFLGPQAYIPCTESIPCENQFRLEIDSWEGGREDSRTKSTPALKIDFYGTWSTQVSIMMVCRGTPRVSFELVSIRNNRNWNRN